MWWLDLMSTFQKLNHLRDKLTVLISWAEELLFRSQFEKIQCLGSVLSCSIPNIQDMVEEDYCHYAGLAFSLATQFILPVISTDFFTHIRTTVSRPLSLTKDQRIYRNFTEFFGVRMSFLRNSVLTIKKQPGSWPSQ